MERPRVIRWLELPRRERALLLIDDIFFSSSNTQSFESQAARLAFRERWLGRYLSYYPEHVYVALDARGGVIGYLAGCFDDPARTALFSDIAYFAELAQVTRRYPAHLHVNLAAPVRGSGVGSDLVRAFVATVAAAALPGVHVVTGRDARNVGFYNRLGFIERAGVTLKGYQLVFLGRDTSGGQ